MAQLLSIGRFSKLCGISIKSLRRYDEQGLLRPARVAPVTGYRYYAATQAADAQQIRALRSLEMESADIRAYLSSPRATDRRRFLEEHRAEVEARVVSGRDVLVAIEQLLRGPVEQSEGYSVGLRDVAAQRLVGVRRRVSDEETNAFIGTSFFDVYRALAGAAAHPAAPGLTLFYETGDEKVNDGVVAVPVATTFQVKAPLVLYKRPAHRVAAALHLGGYDSLADCRRAILRWAERAGVQLGEPQCNVYVVGPAQAPHAAHLRTEVSLPVQTQSPVR